MLVTRIAAILVSGSVLLFPQDAGKPGFKLDTLKVASLGGDSTALTTQGKITAVIFISTQCPVSNAYNERMKALFNEYSARGVDFVFVNANATETGEEVRRHAVEKGFSFKVYKDPGNRLADTLNAQVTPESFVFDRTGTIIYHGAIDDSQKEAGITARPLRDALDAVIASKGVTKSEHKAFGCSIKRVKNES